MRRLAGPAPDAASGLWVAALLLWQASGYAQPGPQPPCGSDPIPPYPVWTVPRSQVLERVRFRPRLETTACTGWTAPGFATLVTTAARFGLPRDLRTCCATSGRFQNSRHALLVDHSPAVADADCERARFDGLAARPPPPDFTPDEMT